MNMPARNLSLITALVVCFLPLAAAQLLTPQTNTFNSSFEFSDGQIQQASLTAEQANNAAIGLNFERSNWATGSVGSDPFYEVPANFSPSITPPGALLKLELVTNTSLYTLPPNTALSRILFTSSTLNGSTVPASAYVLWPFSPNLQPGTSAAQLIAWGHGASGVFGECAPSHVRNLWYQFQAPYALALAGYAVVAPDYAGQGVNYTLDENGTRKEQRMALLSNPSAGNDLVLAVQAAQAAFPDRLSKEFVIMGHSEGGGAAWGAAERLAKQPVDGYLGTVAVSPVTDVGATVRIAVGVGVTTIPGGAGQAWSLLDVFPDFELSEILTPKGINRLNLVAEVGGCNGVSNMLLSDPDLYQDKWWEDYYLNSYWNMTTSGGRAVAGPMFVIQGTEDMAVFEPLTTGAVNATCQADSGTQLEYLTVEGTTHVPTLFATQRYWLAWIQDRFNGVECANGCSNSRLASFLPVTAYQREVNWFMEWSRDAYQLA